MSCVNRTCRASLLHVCCIMVLCGSACAEGDDEAKAVVEAWAGHWEGFHTFLCKYRLTKGIADKREAAIAGELLSSQTARVVWARDGDRELCKVVDGHDFDLNGPAQSAGDVLTYDGYVNEWYLALGEFRGHGSKTVMSMRGLGASPLSGVRTSTPFGMGVMGPGSVYSPLYFVERCIKERRLVTAEHVNRGEEDVRIVLQHIDERPGVQKFEFDPTRSMMLTSYVAGTDSKKVECVVTDAKETASGWFPMRAVVMMNRGAALSVELIEVDDISVAPVNSSVFTVKVPAGFVVNGPDANAEMKLDAPTTITADDLPKYWEKMGAKSAEYQSYVDAKATVITPARRWLTWGTVGLVGLCVGLIAYRRWSHQAPRRSIPNS